MLGPAFARSSGRIAGKNSTLALAARNHGSARAGICDASVISTIRMPPRFPSSAMKYAASGLRSARIDCTVEASMPFRASALPASTSHEIFMMNRMVPLSHVSRPLRPAGGAGGGHYAASDFFSSASLKPRSICAIRLRSLPLSTFRGFPRRGSLRTEPGCFQGAQVDTNNLRVSNLRTAYLRRQGCSGSGRPSAIPVRCCPGVFAADFRADDWCVATDPIPRRPLASLHAGSGVSLPLVRDRKSEPEAARSDRDSSSEDSGKGAPMAFKPHYRQQRGEPDRQARAKQAEKLKKLHEKSEQRKAERDRETAPPEGEQPG